VSPFDELSFFWALLREVSLVESLRDTMEYMDQQFEAAIRGCIAHPKSRPQRRI
jgi:hypothetical protein